MKKILPLLIAAMMMTSSCSVLEQASELSSLSKCEFRLKNVQNPTLAGIEISKIDSADDLGLMDYARLTSAIASNNLPLSFLLNVESRNPNTKIAAMNRMNWILYVDDIEMTSGLVNQRVEIPPGGGSAIIPVNINVNLMEVLQGESGEALLNFGFNIAGSGERPTRILMKLKPTIYVGSNEIEYPGYINVKTEFTSGSTNTYSF
jgi:LEA14-like dessication related protein